MGQFVVREARDFRNRPYPRITQTLLGATGEFSISCAFLGPSHSDWHKARTYRHPAPPFTRIFVMERGDAIVATDSGVRCLRHGCIYMLPPEHPFEATYKNCAIKAFHLDITDSWGFPIGAELDDVLEIRDRRLFESILAAVKLGDEACCHTAVFQAVIVFCRPLFPGLEYRARLSSLQRNVLAMITNTPPGILRIGSIARKLGVTRSALSKNFARRFGISLKAHLMNTALKRGKELLLSSALSVSEIAYQLGYKEPAYFQRLFKREVGLTPLGYRRRCDFYSCSVQNRREGSVLGFHFITEKGTNRTPKGILPLDHNSDSGLNFNAGSSLSSLPDFV